MDGNSISSERVQLKKYAICKCLLQKFNSDTMLRNDGSIDGYVETSSYSNLAYKIVDSFLTVYESSKYESKNQKNLYLMQCIDLMNNAKLDSVIKKQNTYINK